MFVPEFPSGVHFFRLVYFFMRIIVPLFQSIFCEKNFFKSYIKHQFFRFYSSSNSVMQTILSQFADGKWQGLENPNNNSSDFQLVLVFGERTIMELRTACHELQQFYPNATIVTASTAGEIYKNAVYANSIVAAGIYFEKTTLAFSIANIEHFQDSYTLGAFAAAELPEENLQYVLVISDGNKVNGTALTKALTDKLGNKVLVTGGLAGDQARFEKTLVGMNGDMAEGNVVLVGLYGDAIKTGYGLQGGWDVFGPRRIITKSVGNVLHEIDGKKALDLYKTYLGKYADELPGSALLFPLAIQNQTEDQPIVRTILSIDEVNQTMTFAGDMPQGAHVRLMKANFDKLIDSAGQAASDASTVLGTTKPGLVLLISCVGRKLVLDNRIDEEVEAALDYFEEGTPIIGFYSYGEISPNKEGTCSDLHNQTMTITTFTE